MGGMEKIFTPQIRGNFEQKYGVKIELITDSTDCNSEDKKNSIEIKGVKDKVNICKKIILKKIEENFLLNFILISVPLLCLKDIGPSFLFEISKKGDGISVGIDREGLCIRIFGDEKNVKKIESIINLKLSQFGEHHCVIHVEEYMLSTIVGSKGNAIIFL